MVDDSNFPGIDAYADLIPTVGARRRWLRRSSTRLDTTLDDPTLSTAVAVDGVTSQDARVPLLRDGVWQLA
jgi:hypothetical protein